MTEAARPGPDLEALLSDALRPIDPPEDLRGRVEETLSKVTEAAATELSEWADELSESELASLRDPRNWVRPVAAAAAGGVAGTALVLLELRRRRRHPGRPACDNRRPALAPGLTAPNGAQSIVRARKSVTSCAQRSGSSSKRKWRTPSSSTSSAPGIWRAKRDA